MKRNLYLSVASCLAIGVVAIGMAIADDSDARVLALLGGLCFIGVAVYGLYLGRKYR